jgi:hypothetical protein
MNIKKLSTLLVVLTLTIAASAQSKIYFCDDVSDDGKPIGNSNTKAVIYPEEGGSLYVLYTATQPVKEKELNVKVELKNDKGVYVVVQNTKVETEVGKKWFTFDIIVEKQGDYKITVQTLSKTDLATGTVKVTEVEEEEVVEETEE